MAAVLDLVDREQHTDPSCGGRLAEFAEQTGEITVQLAGIKEPGHRVDVDDDVAG
ncbi:MAG: hypothetical protein ACRD0A_15790 [Acidimicrobiales bacterium]